MDSNNIDLFISHSNGDEILAHSICEKLEENQIKCWLEKRDIPLGKSKAAAIKEAIVKSTYVLVIISHHSKNSIKIEREVLLARKYKKNIIPAFFKEINLEGSLEYHLSNLHPIELFESKREIGAEKLVELITRYFPERTINLDIKKEHMDKELHYSHTLKTEPVSEVQGKEAINRTEESEKLNKIKTVKVKKDNEIKPNKEEKELKLEKLDNKTEGIPSGDEDEDYENTEEKRRYLAIVNEMVFLKNVDKFLLALSLFYMGLWIISKFPLNLSVNSISLSTVVFLILTSYFLRKSKSSTDYDSISLFKMMFYIFIVSAITYYLTINFMPDLPGTFSKAYIITIFFAIVTTVIIMASLEYNFFTRFGTGILVGYWCVKIHLYYETQDLGIAISLGVQETIQNYGLILLIIGFVFMISNTKSRILANM